ncbi:MAG: GDSL-type esterase/lipase family protein, partial [Pseudomonadota bacterium]
MSFSRRSLGLLLGLAIVLVLAAGGLLTARHLYAESKLQRAADTASPTRFSGDWDKAAVSVLIIGDSRVARWSPLPKDDKIAFALSGSGGETSHELLGRAGRQVQSLSPDVVVILVGVNDVVAAQVNPSKAAKLEAALSQNVIQIAQSSKSAGAKPIIAAIGQAGPIDWRRRLMGIDDELYIRIEKANQDL